MRRWSKACKYLSNSHLNFLIIIIGHERYILSDVLPHACLIGGKCDISEGFCGHLPNIRHIIRARLKHIWQALLHIVITKRTQAHLLHGIHSSNFKVIACLLGDNLLQLHDKGTNPSITKALDKGNNHADTHITQSWSPIPQVAQVDGLDVLKEEVIVLG